MNYYEHHLGDYLRDTAHLSMLEDGAYRRLIDAYYIRETALPVELRDVFRLVRAQSKQDREAAQTVLQEFFHLTDAGWVHHRCDREIAKFHESEPDREAKRENERERQRRTRERRKQLFEVLRQHGIVPAYDAPMSELVALESRVKSRDVTQPVTRDATATHTHSPYTNTSTEANASVSVAASRRRPTKKAPPDLALTDDLKAWAAEHAPAVDAYAELAKLKDHTFATARTDWPGTVRNWLRKAQENADSRPPRVVPMTKPDRIAEANIAVVRRFAERSST